MVKSRNLTCRVTDRVMGERKKEKRENNENERVNKWKMTWFSVEERGRDRKSANK